MKIISCNEQYWDVRTQHTMQGVFMCSLVLLVIESVNTEEVEYAKQTCFYLFECNVIAIHNLESVDYSV